MADEVKQYPDFPRLVNRESITVDSGYELQAGSLIEALAEGLKKVPVEYQHRAGVVYPDEYGDEWGINWWHYEPDEKYEARYAAHCKRIKDRDDQFLADHATLTAALNRAQNIEAKRTAAAALERLEYRMKEAKCPVPTN